MCCISEYFTGSRAESHSPKDENTDLHRGATFVMPNFKCIAKLANESPPTPPQLSLSLSFSLWLYISSSVSLSCACCHGDMTRKQRRSDETEWRGLEVAVIEGVLPNKPHFWQLNCWIFCSYKGLCLSFGKLAFTLCRHQHHGSTLTLCRTSPACQLVASHSRPACVKSDI